MLTVMRDWFLIRFHLELVNHQRRQFVPSLQPSSPLPPALSLPLTFTYCQSVLTIRYLVVSDMNTARYLDRCFYFENSGLPRGFVHNFQNKTAHLYFKVESALSGSVLA